jgi:hypothetical protein
MKFLKRAAAATAVLALLSASAGAFVIVTKPSDPVKWSQWVDIDNGRDVYSFGDLDEGEDLWAAVVTADDWRCPDGLPVSDFHWWGSYILGDPADLLGFAINIHADVPASGIIPSHPGTRLWSGLFPMGDVTGTVQETLFAITPDHDIYQYNLQLPGPDQYFYQDEGVIYWLDIIGIVGPEGIWGWHTALRPAPENGLDAAVIIFDYNALTGGYSQWGSMHDDHCNVQMAFELTTIPEPASMALLGTGAMALLTLVRRRRISRDDS